MSLALDAPLVDAPEAGARDRKKRETWDRIHRVAVELALVSGMAGVTVEEIAAAAAVSQRTFFNYFPTKLDALVGHDPALIDRVAATLVDRPCDEDLATAVREVVTAHLAYLTSDTELWRLRRELADRTPELSARLAGAGHRLEEALVRAAYVRTGTDPATDIATGVTARVGMAALRAAMAQHRAAGLQGSMLERLDAAFEAAGQQTA